MNNNRKKMGIRLLAAMLFAMAVCFQSFAATARIAFSDPSAQVGEEVSVTMKFTSTSGEMLGDTDVMLAYDATALEFISGTGNVSGGTGAIRVKSAPAGSTEAVTELKFKALKAGTTTITVSSWEGYDNNGEAINVEREGTSTITVNGLETSSNDATLQSLQVSPGTLTPSFSPSEENYTVEVGLETTKLTVSAAANNSSAVVEVEGGDDLQEGTNTVVCKVTAEDGTTVKNYTLTVNKVEGGANPSDAEGTETAAEEPEVLAELDVTAKKIRVIALPDGVEVPEGFKESSIAIGDVKVPGWTWAADETPRYCVLYGMNEEGEQDFYRYDLKERTIQRYFADENSTGITQEQYITVAEDYNSLLEDYRICRIIMFIAIAAAVVLLIALIVVAKGASGRSKRDRKDGQDGGGDDSGRRQEPRVSRAAGGRKLTREERYMMGEEEDYEDDDSFADDEDAEADAEAYQPEPADEAPVTGKKADEALVTGRKADHAPAAGKKAGSGQRPVSAGDVADVERQLAQDLAKEAAATAEPKKESDDEDDFEFFDL